MNHILLSMGKMNGKFTSGTQRLSFVTFQVWLTGLHFFCTLQQKTNPRRAFNATLLLLTEKNKKLCCVHRHTVQIHGVPYS